MPKAKSPGKLKAGSAGETPRAERMPTPEDVEGHRRKMEAARALGLLDKVEKQGWGGLTAAESGRIGGWMTRLRWAEKRQQQSSGDVSP